MSRMTSKKKSPNPKRANRIIRKRLRTILVIGLLTIPVALAMVLFCWLPNHSRWLDKGLHHDAVFNVELESPSSRAKTSISTSQEDPSPEPKPTSLMNVAAEDTFSAEEVSRLLEEPNEHPPTPKSPWIAVIIDDFGPGISRRLVKKFIRLPFDITISTLPGNTFTAQVSEKAEAAGKEVFIHLPMEPYDSVAMVERDMVYCNMTALQVAAILDRAQEELPLAVGVNNHMGSKATADSALMRLIAEELRDRGLVFVDSRTAPNSVALAALKRAGVPALGRDVFLDFTLDKQVIAEQMDKAVALARRRGWAVVIGHVKPETLEVLRSELPRWTGEGIRFVSASRLIEALTSPAAMAEK